MTNGSLLCADPAILQLHADVQDYAVAVVTSIAMPSGAVSLHPLSGGALYALTAELLGIHGAVLCLCVDGWAFAAVSLLRSMTDLFMNAAVITEREPEAEYRGFKYTHFFLKAQLNKGNLPSEDRAGVRSQIEEGINHLPGSHQQKARDFMFRERLWGYWYCPEYKRPTEILDRLCSPGTRLIYNTFSGGAHGSYLGLRLLKDDPDQIHPYPRADPRSQDMSLVASIRTLLEAMNLCDHFENAGVHQGTYQALFRRLLLLRRA